MAETTVKDSSRGCRESERETGEGRRDDCVYQFRVTDAAWNVKLTDGKVAVAEGEAPSRTAPSRSRRPISSTSSPES